MNEAIIDSFKTLIDAIGVLSNPKVDPVCFEPLIQCLNSLPTDIRESEVFKRAESINGSTKTEDIMWMFYEKTTLVNLNHPEYYISNNFNVESSICEYIKKIVLNETMDSREKIVVILSVFEPFLHLKICFDSIKGIKVGFKNRVIRETIVSAETYALAYTYAIVMIVFARIEPDDEFDRNLPHRNDILHNGTIDYSDEEITEAYTMLLSFICFIDEMFDDNESPLLHN